MAEAMLNTASLSYVESFPVEDEIVTAARDRAREFGCVPIGPAGGATLAGLESAAGHLRSRIGRALRLRVAPEISFECDDTIARAARIDALLAEVRPPAAGGSAAGEPPAGDASAGDEGRGD